MSQSVISSILLTARRKARQQGSIDGRGPFDTLIRLCMTNINTNRKTGPWPLALASIYLRVVSIPSPLLQEWVQVHSNITSAPRVCCNACVLQCMCAAMQECCCSLLSTGQQHGIAEHCSPVTCTLAACVSRHECRHPLAMRASMRLPTRRAWLAGHVQLWPAY